MSLISSMVALADSLTQSFGLQADIQYWAYVSSNGAGKVTYSPPYPGAGVVVKAIVDKRQRMVKTASGELVQSQASVTFLRPTTINLFDRIVLPDGTTGPILNTGAFMDGSNAGILTEVYLG